MGFNSAFKGLMKIWPEEVWAWSREQTHYDSYLKNWGNPQKFVRAVGVSADVQTELTAYFILMTTRIWRNADEETELVE